MKVLFVLSGNKDKSSNLVVNQAESIISYDKSIVIEYFLVKGKGLTGYLKNIKPLKQKIRTFNPDVIHAHYSFCGILSFLSFSKKPIITSLMGSDLHLKLHWRLVLFISSAFWNVTIVKSKAMLKKYLLSKTVVIPNGVSLDKYPEIGKEEARRLLGLETGKTFVLFLADPGRPEKNFQLAKKACELIKDKYMELLVVNHIPHEQTRLYYYAVDVLVLSSFYEGSPNVIKEAMVCNCPIVSTDVGDVSILFDGVQGNFISDFTPEVFSEKIKLAIVFARQHNRTEGRTRIMELGIDAGTIARKIYGIYSEAV
jgi:teichuronic acid biosynthesis glycosyltransferase TuaC